MNKHTTKHRPTKDEMLAAMQEMYGDHITWEDMHVVFERENGQTITITDPEVVFVGDMSPDIIQGETGEMEGYEEACSKAQSHEPPVKGRFTAKKDGERADGAQESRQASRQGFVTD